MDVERLFQTSSIAAVREVHIKTRHEIEEKKKQLRSVVGDSYRDLISSADTIIDISRSCRRLVDLTASLQGGLGDLAGGVAARAVGAGGEPEAGASSYDRLYALGSRIKYLVDTPETIYGCLDGGEYLAAARRYGRAAEVHRALVAGGTKHVAQRFPLLQHQWPLVKKFRPQVYNAAGAWLGSHGELTAEQAAAALAAQALLKPMDGAEVLKAFLTARQAYIMQCLSAATGASADTDLDSLACILADVATLVCATLAQAGELFLQLPGISATPLLAAALAAEEDGTSADLIFDSGREAEAWRASLEAARCRLAELSSAGLALECSQWLDQLSQSLRSAGARLLGPCTSGQGLLAVEAAVRAALEEWRYAIAVGGSTEAADAAAVGADGSGWVLAWPDVCQWVLGRPAPLWPLLFEQPLLERAKQLVERDFSTVVDEVTDLLGAALEEAAGLPPSAPGTFQAASWSDVVHLDPSTPVATAGGTAGSKRRRLAGQARPAAGVAAAAAVHPQGWLPQAEHVVRHFDKQLSKALAAALDACGGTAQQPAADARGGARAAAAAAKWPGGLAETAASRAAVLEPFVQDRCAEAAEGIAASLDSRLLALPKQQHAAGDDAAAFAPTAIQSLILGRVALGMASRSRMLPLVLGPPDQWRAAASGGGAAAAAGRRALPGAARLPPGGTATAAAPALSARYERLQQRLHAVGLTAYGAWVDWAVAGLAGALTAGLAADASLSADVPLRSWEETVIRGGGGAGGAEELEADGGGGGLEMRFQLPAAPSPASVQLALAACQEADRAGGHLLEEEPLLLLKWRLGAALLAALGAALAPAGIGSTGGGQLGASLSEKGVLQLLFDVRFLTDLLAGGRPVSASPTDAASATTAVAGRRREVAALEGALSGRLDPIDWATYEPYLYANKERAAARCQVLFGMLLRGDKPAAVGTPGSGAVGGGSMPADSNILRLAPVAPRFSYLPVTTPGALLRQASHPGLHPGLQRSGSSAVELARLGSGLGALAGSSGGGPSGLSAAGATGAEVCAASYSFATLLSSKTRAGGDDDGGGAGAAAAAAGSGGGVASKLVGSLQGLIGDQLGDMGAPGGLGLLSSFSSRFNK